MEWTGVITGSSWDHPESSWDHQESLRIIMGIWSSHHTEDMSYRTRDRYYAKNMERQFELFVIH